MGNLRVWWWFLVGRGKVEGGREKLALLFFVIHQSRVLRVKCYVLSAKSHALRFTCYVLRVKSCVIRKS